MAVFGIMQIYCCICRQETDGMKSYASIQRVCSKECCDELHWRETLAIMNRPYHPRRGV